MRPTRSELSTRGELQTRPNNALSARICHLTWEGTPENFHAVNQPANQPGGNAALASKRWHEIYDAEGNPRPIYRGVLDRIQQLRQGELRVLDERMEATLREMGVTFNPSKTEEPWTCDLLPHIFSLEDWDIIARGTQQRLKAFELFLQDVYGRREILRSGAIPIQPVLGSPHYQNASIGLPRPQGAYLHLSGVCLTRNTRGELTVKHHHFSRSSGISYMMQNRRALARVLPEIFQTTAVRSLAGTPLAVIEEVRSTATGLRHEPSVVLLTPGPDSPVYSAHGFLARRMGIPLVQGGDLLVLEDRLYLKTVRGLKLVDAIYNRVADAWLDPLVFRRDSMLGVPGLIHCLRRGTVTIINGIGSQLADDRSLLCFAAKIIRYYLAEDPILPSTPTYWLGDIDQREMVLENIDAYQIRPILGADLASGDKPSSEFMAEIRKEASQFVAQPIDSGATTVHFDNGRKVELQQDHIVYALRDRDSYEVFPGALTRVFFGAGNTQRPEWISKDTWVLGDVSERAFVQSRPRRFSEVNLPSRDVTSRVADSFYWMGRYLERAHHQAYLIQVVETLETEELNTAERKLYRPMWNRLLPPLETSTGGSRRSMTTRLDRYKLVLLPEPGSVLSTFNRAIGNAESIQECISPEAWAPLISLRSLFQRAKFNDKTTDDECMRVARRLSETVTRRIPQFFSIASNTMLADDGWRFCQIGEMLERAIITSNSVISIAGSLTREAQATEIELSAFLRLLGTRDAYRRVFQMRAEPIPVLELLWQHSQAPRSVLRCLQQCLDLLRDSASPESAGTEKALHGIEALIHKIKRIDWSDFLRAPADEDTPPTLITTSSARPDALEPLMIDLLNSTQDVHQLISDSFLSHQAYIAQTVQPYLQGLQHGI